MRGKVAMRCNFQEFGARFHAKVQRTPDGLRALLNVIAGDGLLADTDVRHFRTDRDVNRWLTDEAGRRGFSSIAVEFVD
jgi:hypothetical protein